MDFIGMCLTLESAKESFKNGLEYTGNSSIDQVISELKKIQAVEKNQLDIDALYRPRNVWDNMEKQWSESSKDGFGNLF